MNNDYEKNLTVFYIFNFFELFIYSIFIYFNLNLEIYDLNSLFILLGIKYSLFLYIQLENDLFFADAIDYVYKYKSNDYILYDVILSISVFLIFIGSLCLVVYNWYFNNFYFNNLSFLLINIILLFVTNYLVLKKIKREENEGK